MENLASNPYFFAIMFGILFLLYLVYAIATGAFTTPLARQREQNKMRGKNAFTNSSVFDFFSYRGATIYSPHFFGILFGIGIGIDFPEYQMWGILLTLISIALLINKALKRWRLNPTKKNEDIAYFILYAFFIAIIESVILRNKG